MRFSMQGLWSKLPLAVLVTFFLLASVKAYIKIQTTLIGYRIGQKKLMEAELLEQQSSLKMELAKITTKQSLIETSSLQDAAVGAWVSH